MAKKKQFKPSPALARAILVVAILEPASDIPQIISLYAHKDATGISVLTWLIYVVFSSVWLFYGIRIKDRPIIISSILFLAAEVLVIAGSSLYGGKLI